MGEGRDREIKSFSDMNLSAQRHKIGRHKLLSPVYLGRKSEIYFNSSQVVSRTR